MRFGQFGSVLMVVAVIAAPVFAQSINSMSMANSSGQSTPPNVVQPPSQAVVPTTTTQAGTQAAPLPNAVQAGPITQAQSYIWFGDDRINEAAGLIKSGRYIEALSTLDKIIQRDVRLTEAHMLQGVAYMQLKDLNKAKQSFATATTIDRGYTGAYIYMADIALQENDTAQARVYLQAIKAICQTTECAEYQYLKNSLRTRGVEVGD
ncbi:MAG TPA: tetratricopeptide repeat protein [Alphaproteobacteria bacterium]